MPSAPPDRRLAAAAAALALALAPAPVRSGVPEDAVEVGDLDLEALLDPNLAAASLHEERSSAAPAAVFVLTSEDLRAGGFRTLSEALRTVPGLFTYSDGFYQYAGVRGTGLLVDYTTRLLVLIDGHPVNNTLGIGENSLGPDLPVPLGLVERIEVVKGPAGGVYGPTAFLGVVNVVTLRGSSPGWAASVDTTLAQGGALGGRISGGGTGVVGGWQVTAGVEAEQSHGFAWTYPELAASTDRPAPPGGVVAGVDQWSAQRAYLRAARHDLELRAGCARWRRGLPSAPYSSIILDERNQVETQACFAQLGVEQPLGERAGIALRLGVDHFAYRDYYAYEPPGQGQGGGTGPFRDHGTDDWLSADVRLRWSLAAPWSFTLGATGEAHDTTQLSQADLIPPLSVDPVNGLGVGTIRASYLTLNTYALAEWEVAAGVVLHGSLSWFWHELFGQRVSPRAALVWRPTPRARVKAIYSEGFRPPTAAEAFFDDEVFFIPNPDVRPETVRSAELRYEHRVAAGVALGLSLFRNHYQDLIVTATVPAPGVPNPDPANPSDFRQQSVNSGSFQVLGGELGVEVNVEGTLRAYGGVSLQQASSGRPNFPAVTGNLAVASRAPWRPLTLSLLAAFTGRRDKDPVALAPGVKPEVGPALRLDARAVLEVPGAPGLTVEAGLANLLDSVVLHPAPQDFAPLTELPEPPRTFRLGLRYQR
ncbi:MAG: TonB-dependent receptor [Anaeromyxobacter sp.]|nr:TonB-dependent receptor [Anaeromyxobacter sp.]MBL0278224.1 TonB-dependent receptor [Anaeromyxobacter sp.]